MRRRINYRVLLIALAVVVIVGGAFHALHVWQAEGQVASYLAYARAAKEAKKLGQAIDLYEQYLKLAPDDLDVHEEFASELDKIAQSPAQRNRVVMLYESLLLKSPGRSAARNRLVENLIQLDRFEPAARQLEILRASWPNPAEIEHKRGWCLAADGKFDLAVQAFQKAVELDPKRLDSWLQLAEVLHHRLARDADAQKALDRMIAANPNSAAAHLARFRYRRMVGGQDADAAKDLAEARRLKPDDAGVLLASSQVSQAKGHFEEARQLLAEGTKLYPANEAMIREHAALELRQGNRKLALETIEKGLKALGEMTETGELQVFRADLLIDEGKTKDAAAIVANLRQLGLPPAMPDFLQARLLVHDKKWSEAQALLDKTRPALASDPYWNGRVNALLAICASQLGEPDRQLAALLEAARTEPHWAALNLSIGKAYLDVDDPEQALYFLRPLLDDPQAPPGAALVFARALLRQTERLPEKERNWKTVDAAVLHAAKSGSDALEMALLRADALQAQHKTDAAREVLSSEIKGRSAKRRPEDLVVWLALADLEARTNDYDAASDVLQGAEKLFGDGPSLRLGKARMLALRGKSDDRDAIKTLADKTDAFKVEDRGRLERDLAEIWLRLGDRAAARALLVRAADDLPRDLRTRALLVDLDLQENRISDARKWLKEMQALEGAGGRQSAYAALLIRVEDDIGDPPALRKLAEELKNSPLRRAIVDGRIELIESRIFDRLGDAELSQLSLREAVVKGQRSPSVLQKLREILRAKKDNDQLAWIISLEEGRGPLPRTVGRAAVETALAQNDVPLARSLLGVVDFESIRDYRELLWLAKTYQAMKDRPLAERALRRAVATAPHTPDTWVALAHFLIGAGKRSQAIDLVAEADRKSPAKQRPFVKARLQQELGNLKLADAAYETAVLDRPTDFVILLAAADYFRQTDQPAIAEALYKKVLKPTVATPPELAARARRGYALVLSAKSPAQAAALLAANKSRNELADLRLGWYLDGLDPARRAVAIDAFDKSASRGPFTADESFWLAQLKDKAGNPDAAIALLAAVVAEDLDTPQMLVFYAGTLIRAGKVDAARPIVDRLLQREPESTRTKAVHAQLK